MAPIRRRRKTSPLFVRWMGAWFSAVDRDCRRQAAARRLALPAVTPAWSAPSYLV